VYVTGNSYLNFATQDDIVTVAYAAATGAEIWTARYSGPNSDGGLALRVSPDGSVVYVAGRSMNTSLNSDYITVAYETTGGGLLWEARYDGPGHYEDLATLLDVSPDGSLIFVSGYSWGESTVYDYATIAYDAASGSPIWLHRYNGQGNNYDIPHAIGVSPDGSTVYLTGTADAGAPSHEDYATIAYAAKSGAMMWARRYAEPGTSGPDIASDLGVSPDGSRVYVTGISYAPGTHDDYATVAYDSHNGARVWVARYNGVTNDTDGATGLGVSPDGSRVYVTGYSWAKPATRANYLTIAYDSTTGSRTWTGWNAGRGDDYPSALSVSPLGDRVFVAGEYQRAVDFEAYDYGTVAFSA
jgi:hypothetical protein